MKVPITVHNSVVGYVESIDAKIASVNLLEQSRVEIMTLFNQPLHAYDISYYMGESDVLMNALNLMIDRIKSHKDLLIKLDENYI